MTTRNYYLKRSGQAVLTFVGVITLTFALFRLMPGSPIAYLKAKFAQSPRIESQARINQLVELYTNINPSEPVWQQYLSYVFGILQGDLGVSRSLNEPVIDILAEAMPWTIFISITSLVLLYLIGISLGAVMAYLEGSRFDVSTSVSVVVLNSVPFYVFAVLLVWYGGYMLGLFPTDGRVAPNLSPGLYPDYVLSILYHAFLPVMSLVLAGLGGRALGLRANAIQVLGDDYLRVARLRGLSSRRIALRYVARNAILPMYTSILVSIGTLFGGSIILETIFTYPGVGYYMFKALQRRDYPLLMGGFLFVTFGVIVGVFLADLTYGLIDPRAEGGEREAY